MPAPPPGPGGSPWILLVQSCLRKLYGPGVTPLDAWMGPMTQRALATFQQQNGLPATGGLDTATVQALQSACMGPSAPPPAPPPPPEAPPPDSAAAPPPDAPPSGADAAAPPPDAGAAAPPADGASPPDGGGAPPPEGGGEPQGEIMLGRREGYAEQEFLVDGSATAEVVHHGPVALDSDPQFNWAPDAPGLYVIYVNNVPWYVGIAEISIRNRFLQRRKVLNDLQIPPSAMAGRTVEWYLLRRSAVPAGSIQRRDKDNPRAAFRPISGKYAILRILEQHYIRNKKPRGNHLSEPVQFTPRGSLTLVENGAQSASYPPGSKL
jgi:hypothetical protein